MNDYQKPLTTSEKLTYLLTDARVANDGCQQSTDVGYPPTKAQLRTEWRRILWALQIAVISEYNLSPSDNEMTEEIKALAAKWGVTL